MRTQFEGLGHTDSEKRLMTIDEMFVCLFHVRIQGEDGHLKTR